MAYLKQKRLEWSQFVKANPELDKISPDDVGPLFQERVELFNKTYHKYKKISNFEYDPDKETSFKELIIERKRLGFCYEFKTLLKRNYTLYFRDPLLTFGVIGMNVSIAIFHVLIYNSMTSIKKDTITGISDKVALMYSAFSILFFFGSVNAQEQIIPNQYIYKRELAGKLYSSTAYFIALYLHVLPIELATQSIIFFNAYFWVSNLENDPGYLWSIHVLNLVSIFMCAKAISYILGSVIRNLETFYAAIPGVILSLFVPSGFLGQVSSMPKHMLYYSYLSPVKWSFQASVCLEFLRDNRYKTYRQDCVMYNDSTKTSVPVSYLSVPMCDVKGIYNFHENFEGCEFFNIGMNVILTVLYFALGLIVFHIFNKPAKI